MSFRMIYTCFRSSSVISVYRDSPFTGYISLHIEYDFCSLGELLWAVDLEVIKHFFECRVLGWRFYSLHGSEAINDINHAERFVVENAPDYENNLSVLKSRTKINEYPLWGTIL